MQARSGGGCLIPIVCSGQQQTEHPPHKRGPRCGMHRVEEPGWRSRTDITMAGNDSTPSLSVTHQEESWPRAKRKWERLLVGD